jgi:hypothetical protein
MTIPVWPTSLPKPSRAGYTAQNDDGRVRRQAGGPPGYRRRFSSTARLVSLSINVTRAEKAVFDRFFEVDTKSGSIPFYMPDPVTDGWGFLTSDGAPVLSAEGEPILLAAQWLCLFGDETPSETIRGITFDIAFSVAVMP